MENETIETKPRVVFIRAPRQMSEEQLREALSSLPEDDPRLVAFQQLLARALGAAVLDASDPQLDVRRGTYPGGRVAAIAELQAELANYRTGPVKVAALAGAKVKSRR